MKILSTRTRIVICAVFLFAINIERASSNIAMSVDFQGVSVKQNVVRCVGCVSLENRAFVNETTPSSAREKAVIVDVANDFIKNKTDVMLLGTTLTRFAIIKRGAAVGEYFGKMINREKDIERRLCFDLVCLCAAFMMHTGGPDLPSDVEVPGYYCHKIGKDSVGAAEEQREGTRKEDGMVVKIVPPKRGSDSMNEQEGVWKIPRTTTTESVKGVGGAQVSERGCVDDSGMASGDGFKVPTSVASEDGTMEVDALSVKQEFRALKNSLGSVKQIKEDWGFLLEKVREVKKICEPFIDYTCCVCGNDPEKVKVSLRECVTFVSSDSSEIVICAAWVPKNYADQNEVTAASIDYGNFAINYLKECRRFEMIDCSYTFENACDEKSPAMEVGGGIFDPKVRIRFYSYRDEQQYKKYIGNPNYLQV